MIDYLVYDVFTDRPFGGNPLAIVPNGPEVPEALLGRIAAEFNYSETVFLFPPEADGVARVRIFTPTMEVPFAGHPTIGTAVFLGQSGVGPRFTLELGVGPMEVESDGVEASFVTTTPLEVLAHPDVDVVARALGVAADRIKSAPVMAGVGLAFTFTELMSREDLAALTPDVSAFREGHARYPGGLDFAQAAFVRDGSTIHLRMFAPLDNVPEDPATGSAAAALGALLAQTEGPLSFVIHQGDDMGRPSRIHVSAEPGRVRVAGQAVRMMEGKLAL